MLISHMHSQFFFITRVVTLWTWIFICIMTHQFVTPQIAWFLCFKVTLITRKSFSLMDDHDMNIPMIGFCKFSVTLCKVCPKSRVSVMSSVGVQCLHLLN